LRGFDKDVGIGTGWINEGTKKGRRGNQFMQQFEPLRPEVRTQRGHPREVASWMVEAGDKPARNWIAAQKKDDRNRHGRPLCGDCPRRGSRRSDNVHSTAHKIGCKFWQPIVMTARKAVFDCNIASFDVAGFSQTFVECGDEICELLRGNGRQKPDHRHCRLLRARRERPRRRATEQRYELAALHVGPSPPESVYRTFSLPQGGRRVL
jgi:hypothetical protein